MTPEGEIAYLRARTYREWFDTASNIRDGCNRFGHEIPLCAIRQAALAATERGVEGVVSVFEQYSARNKEDFWATG